MDKTAVEMSKLATVMVQETLDWLTKVMDEDGIGLIQWEQRGDGPGEGEWTPVSEERAKALLIEHYRGKVIG